MTSAPGAAFRTTEVRTREGRTLLVKEYSAGDFGALVEMYKTFLPKLAAQGLPPPDVPRIARWLDTLQSRSSALLAWDGDRAVAHAVLCPIRDDCAEFSIFVHQNYRQQGLGTALSKLTLDWAVAMALHDLYLTTEICNVPAMRLFLKLGFQSFRSSANECEMKLELVEGGMARPQAA